MTTEDGNRIQMDEAVQKLPFAIGDFEALPAAPPLVINSIDHVDELCRPHGARALYLTSVLSTAQCKFLIEQLKGQKHAEEMNTPLRTCGRAVFDTPELAAVISSRLNPVLQTLSVKLDLNGNPSLVNAVHMEDDVKSYGNPPMYPAEMQPRSGAAAENQMTSVIKISVPKKDGVWHPTGLNPRLRFCHYDAGGFFRAHCDGQHIPSNDDMTLYTCMIYLDDEFEGGATRFLNPHLRAGTGVDAAMTVDQITATVNPEAGSCLLFWQPGLLHEGEQLTSGFKHILRSDVMFHRQPGSGKKMTDREVQAHHILVQAQMAESAKKLDEAAMLYGRAFRLDPTLEKCA